MSDPTTPDTLTAAAERAETHQEKRQRLATQAADRFVHDHKTIVCQEYRHDRCAYGKHPDAQECLCECHDEPEPGPAPTSAVDRQALIDALESADDDWPDEVGSMGGISDGYRAHLADALLSSGHVTRAWVVERALTVEQVETAARELHRRDLGDVNAWMVESEHRRDMWRSKARAVAKAFGLSVAEPAVEADHGSR